MPLPGDVCSPARTHATRLSNGPPSSQKQFSINKSMKSINQSQAHKAEKNICSQFVLCWLNMR